MYTRKDKNNECDTAWGTLEEIIRNACIPHYHQEDKGFKYPKSGLHLDRNDLLKFLVDTGIDVTKKTALTRAACRKYISGNDDRFYYDEFYQRFSDVVWSFYEFDVDIKGIIAAILNIDDIERFDELWCFISTCYGYGVLARFIAKDPDFITTILNVTPDHLENVRSVLIHCKEHLGELISKKEKFIADLMSIDPGALARCISSLNFNDMMKGRYGFRGDHLLYNCENILVLLNEKKIKCFSELADILWAINDQAEFNMLVENANNLPFIYQYLLKANNSSSDFKEMPPERFSACLSNICSAARLLNNSFVLFNKNDQGVQGDEVISRPEKTI